MENLNTWLKDLYDLQGKITPMPGYEDDNFKLEIDDGRKFIVKVSKDTSEIDLIRAQSKLLKYLSDHDRQALYPDVIESVNGGSMEEVTDDRGQRILRVLRWVSGSMLKDSQHTRKLFNDLGRQLGKLDSTLINFSNYFINQRFSTWDLQHALLTFRDLDSIRDHSNRRLADYFYLQFETNFIPESYSLRKSIIHADANDYNILVNDDSVSGIIDFGDCVYSPLINELAIAMAYALMGKKDLLEWSASMVSGYHENLPLQENELKLLYYLVSARLAVSVTKSAVSREKQPDNKYLIVSELPAWELLWKWLELNPVKFTQQMKDVCGIANSKNFSLSSQWLKDRNRHISGSLSISYNDPVPMDMAAMQYMYSSDGRVYLDCVNNICHVGHCNPRVVRAGQKQMALLNTNTRYLYKVLNDYAEKLTSRFPEPLDTIFFVNSGSEAGDLAQRIARTVTGFENTLVVDHGYHGNTIAGIEVSPYKFEGKGGPGKSGHVHKLDIPDGFRGEYRYADPKAGEKYAGQVASVTEKIDAEGQGIAAFYCESIIGCGGQVVLPQGYLRSVYQQIRKAGGLCIADEVQVGFGRVGDKFWGFELQDVVPDIVILGKPMGNGHPLAAVVTTREIASKFNTGMEYFSSFGGNPVSCKIGLEVLKVIEEEDLQKHARETGDYFKTELLQLSTQHECIGDVRGHGLFLGVEFVESNSTLEPATSKTKLIVEEMKQRGILLSTDGPYNNVIKIKPPMVFNKLNADRVVSTLDEVLNKIG